MHRLQLFGRIDLVGPSGDEIRDVLVQPKRVAILAYLALAASRGPVRRDNLLGLFWPELDESRARKALNKAIHFLRQALGDAAIVSRGDEEVQVDRQQLWCDACAFEEAIDGKNYAAALELYAGELLPGFFVDAAPAFDEWLEAQRLRLRRSAAVAASGVSVQREHEGNIGGAVVAARRAVDVMPDDEPAVRRLVALLEKDGDRSGALRVYDDFANRLSSEFGVTPAAETRALLGSLRSPAHVAVNDSASYTAAAAPRRVESAEIGRTATVRPAPLSRTSALALGAVLLVALFATWQFTRPAVMGGAKFMAIAPFAVTSGDSALSRMGEDLVSTISANIDGLGDIQVADPIAVLSQTPPRSGLLSVAEAIRLAKTVRARSVLHGSLTPDGALVRIDAALYNADETASPIARVSVVAPRDSLSAVTDSITWAVLREVWNKGRPPTPVLSSITTRSVASLRAFLEGEKLFAHGHPLEAADAYRRAITADTTFWFAYFKHRLGLSFFNRNPDTLLMKRLHRHIADLPDRERVFVATIDSTLDQNHRIAAYRNLSARYPGYAPIWFVFGDYAVHHAPRAGHDVRDAIVPWQQAVRLMPTDQETASHLAMACVIAGSQECATPAFQHFDSLVRSDSVTGVHLRALHRYLAFVRSPHRSTRDDLLAVAQQDTAFPALFMNGRMWFARAMADRPDLAASYDTLVRTMRAAETGAPGVARDVIEYCRLTDDVMRGDLSRRADLLRLRARLGRNMPVNERHALRIIALAELQGFIPPSSQTMEIALDGVNAVDNPGARTDRRWIGAVNALLRNDTRSFEQQLQLLRSDTSGFASIAVRSLTAIANGRAGNRRVAADSLLALERQHASFGVPPSVFTALAADRILAAQWLIEQGRFAPADSLLRFTRGWLILSQAEAAQSVFAFAQLLRSRAAEGLNDRDEAIASARMFLATFDKAPISQEPLIAEARNRIARLSPSSNR